MARPRTARTALTLVEVLVVIAIIGVLWGCCCRRCKRRARRPRARTSCQSNLHQIAMAVHQYYDTHRGYFFLHHPFLADVDAQVAAADSFAEIYWEDKLQPFIGGQLAGDPEGLARGNHRRPDLSLRRTIFLGSSRFSTTRA